MRTAVQNDLGWGALVAVVSALVGGFFMWLTQRSKGGTDIEVAVLAEWQKLNAALSQRVSALEAQLAEVRRAHANEIDEMRQTHRAEMNALRELNEGLQRQIAQNSQSAAHLMGENPVTGRGNCNGD